jgi:low temperature requirement protein LtrA
VNEPQGEREVRVTTLELFFDLVFVFTITQLTAVLAHDPTGEGLLQVVLMLCPIWWMYGGYCWLTNAVTPRATSLRLALLGGMACWLVISMAIPGAFTGDGEVFAAAFFLVVLIHTAMYTRTEVRSAAIAILRVARLNLAAAGLILAGAIVAEAPWEYLLWGAAVAVLWATPRLGGFQVRAAHFVERHGLVVIVALGESVVAVGIGASGQALTAELLAVAVLGLALTACLWWSHFADDEEGPVRALATTPQTDLVRVALNSFYYSQLLILLGIIAIAAALEEAIGHAFDPLEFGRALSLAGGTAVFFIGDFLFRRALSLPSSPWRLAAAALALATIPLGTEDSAMAQLATLVALMVLCLAGQHRTSAPAVRGRRASSSPA